MQHHMEHLRDAGTDAAHGPPPCKDGNPDPRLARILRCIDERLDDPALGCDMLQEIFFVSRPTLYRMFQPLGGVSRYIRNRRLAAARRRLREEPERSITWLLYDLGFVSERQFQRAFLARYGLSPHRWRAQSTRPAGRQAGRHGGDWASPGG